MQDARFTKMLSTYSEVNLTAAHYIIQKSILLHYLEISNSDQHLFQLWCWKVRKKYFNPQYPALLYDDDTRILVAFLLFFLLAVDAFKLGLGTAQPQSRTVYFNIDTQKHKYTHNHTKLTA